MHTRHLLAVAATAALAAVSTPAHAQYPGLIASFLEPTGTVSPTETIDVWVRLSLAPGATPIAFDGTSPGADPTMPFGIPAGLLPAFDTYTTASTSTARTCSGTFTNACDPGAYAFSFHTSNADPTRPSFFGRSSFALDHGDTFDFLLGRFIPQGGAAAPGTYTFYGAEVRLAIRGLDATGAPVPAQSIQFSATTCRTGDDACAFTRTVTSVSAVPEPGSVALVATGLVGLAWAARRRRA